MQGWKCRISDKNKLANEAIRAKKKAKVYALGLRNEDNLSNVLTRNNFLAKRRRTIVTTAANARKPNRDIVLTPALTMGNII